MQEIFIHIHVVNSVICYLILPMNSATMTNAAQASGAVKNCKVKTVTIDAFVRPQQRVISNHQEAD